jgi:ribosomal protein S18 acetylase RimI-like enzyme
MVLLNPAVNSSLMDSPLDYLIRPATSSDEPFLWEMLYQAIFVPPGTEPPPREILDTPELARYVAGWGKPDDIGLVAVFAPTQQPIGAAWLRLWTDDSRGYGYVGKETPELSVAVVPEHRGRGVGGSLLTRLLREVENRYNTISLSVSEENPGVRLYERLDFVMVRNERGSITMIRGCDNRQSHSSRDAD